MTPRPASLVSKTRHTGRESNSCRLQTLHFSCISTGMGFANRALRQDLRASQK